MTRNEHARLYSCSRHHWTLPLPSDNRFKSFCLVSSNLASAIPGAPPPDTQASDHLRYNEAPESVSGGFLQLERLQNGAKAKKVGMKVSASFSDASTQN